MNKFHILSSAFWIFFSGVMTTLAEEPEETINQNADQTDQNMQDQTKKSDIDQLDQTDQKNQDQTKKPDPDFVKAVKEALNVIKKQSPQVHEDALRIWKNFKPSSKPVHYTYRVWGRSIILWLKDEKKMTFQSEQEVGEVFKVLWREGLISQNAVVVLMVDAWSYLVYLEGSPAWENRMEKRSPQEGTTPMSPEQRRPHERSI